MAVGVEVVAGVELMPLLVTPLAMLLRLTLALAEAAVTPPAVPSAAARAELADYRWGGKL
jgi:hypothetical protein